MANKTTKKTTKKASAQARKTVKTTKNAVKPKTKVTAKTSVVETLAAVETPKKTNAQPAFRLKKSIIISVLVIILIAALLYAGRSFFIAAMVNGHPITRFEIISELEKQSGQATLDNIVTKTLILQEAQKQNIIVTDEEIDQELKTIEDNLKQQGQNLDQVLALQGTSREALREDTRLRKSIEKMIGPEVVVTEQEVTDYIASNSAMLPEDMPEDQLKTSVEQQLRQQKLSEKFQTWLQNLKQNADVNYLVNY